MQNNLSSLKEIQQYRSSKNETHLILDTNVLILFLIGIYDVNYISDCPLMIEDGKNYTEEHFKLVENIIKNFPNKIVITPHILSEINMLSQKKISPKTRLHEYFTKLIKQLENCNEHFISLKILLNSGGIIEFGITDISLIELAKEKKWLILTDDSKLYYKFAANKFIIYFHTLVVNEISLK